MASSYCASAAHANAVRWDRHHADPGRWFWDRVDQSAGPDACWPWLGTLVQSRRGYGRLIFKGKHVGAHRMALALASSQDGAGLFACHRCDNPPCCNPRHLFWGTPLENTRDCLAKGRRKAPHPRKIDLEEVVMLRAEGWPYAGLAKRYGVNQASIGKALARAIAANQEKDVG